jgi:hypothetical protein
LGSRFPGTVLSVDAWYVELLVYVAEKHHVPAEVGNNALDAAVDVLLTPVTRWAVLR